ncbi:PD-(D/E)XK nuclease family protein [Candidatus Saccharibacteria bacterium]|nr:PD-(D/E)XK nuclease family protein [Candidatus Saccharibacteria bacterium]
MLDRKLSYNYLTTLSAIQILQALTDDFVARPSAQLADFVRFIDLSRAGKVLIADSSPFVTASSAVDLLTVHKAKGLEFDTAFIIDATEANWTPRGGGRKPPANLPLQPYGDDFDDYVRLMYVAMTRARHSVIITSYGEDELGNEVPATPLVREAIPQRLKSSTHKPNLQVLEHTGGWPELDHSRRLTLLRPILDNYRLSVSGLLNFLDVTQAGPDYFRRRDILRLPEMTTVNQAYGTAIHKALETAQHLRNAGHFSLKKVEQMYEQALSRQPISRDELARYLPHGLAVLLQLFKKYNYRLPKGSLPEQQLSDIVIGLARVGGTLDRIDITGEQSLTIVDYKTGKPLRSFVTRDQAKAVKAWRQRTQLIFYALLVQRSPRFGKRSKISTQIVYVEAESPNQLAHAYDPGPEEMERLEQLLQAVWQHIQTANFPAIDRYSTDIKGIQQFEDDLLAGTI